MSHTNQRGPQICNNESCVEVPLGTWWPGRNLHRNVSKMETALGRGEPGDPAWGMQQLRELGPSPPGATTLQRPLLTCTQKPIQATRPNTWSEG